MDGTMKDDLILDFDGTRGDDMHPINVLLLPQHSLNKEIEDLDVAAKEDELNGLSVEDNLDGTMVDGLFLELDDTTEYDLLSAITLL